MWTKLGRPPSFSKEIRVIKDSFGRIIDYVRISVTDRCNLRCYYCMPKDVIFAPKKELLSYEEMLSLLTLLQAKGIKKVRITGGEPLARKNIMYFFKELSKIGFDEITLTTNGVLVHEYLDELKSLGINRINLSLDTLNREKFHKITFRDSFDSVMSAMDKMLEIGMSVRMNVVLMQGINDDELIDLASLSLKKNIGVRFIEEMPFDGSSNEKSKNFVDYKTILSRLQSAFPTLKKIDDDASSTSLNYTVPGSPGSIGLIPAFSRTFCSTCNRIRITSFGELKTCLYEGGGVSLRDIMRDNPEDGNKIWDTISTAINAKFENGFEAEKADKTSGFKQSMSEIGG